MDNGRLEIKEATAADVELLMQWRMEVLHEVFAIPADADTAELEHTNRAYYRQQLREGGHVAVLAQVDGVTVGCGGLCLQQEMPSPDNPDGRCAYLMNVYCRQPYRLQGVGREIAGWLVARAKAMGIGKIYLETSAAGRRLYRSLGFAEMKDMMRLEF